MATGEIGRRIAELEARLRAAERARDDALAREAAAKALADAAQRTRAEFLSLVSHELRTPLNAILGYVDVLRLEVHGPLTPDQTRSLAQVTRNAQQLLGLVTDLLNLTRLSRGEIDSRVEIVSVDKLCAAIIPLGQLLAAAKGLTYDVTSCDPLVAVQTDPTLAEQVLRNLVSNAFKFTSAPGTVTLTCRVEQTVVRFEVRDTGRGLPGDRLETIFDPFVQLDPQEIPERRRGVGLGLSIARELARLLGGDIEAASIQGVGSTFTLVLPRAPQ